MSGFLIPFIIGLVAGTALCFACLWLSGQKLASKLRTPGLTSAKKMGFFGFSRLSPFFSILETHKRKVHHFLETVEDMGSEISSLVSRHELLTENLAAAVVVRNAEGKLTYCSPYIEVLTGYSTSEIYNSETDFFLNIVHEDDRETYRRALKVSDFGEAFQFRYRFYHKTGILMWAETRTVPILDHEGNVTSSLSVTLDVTGTILYQKQVEEKNRDLQDFTYMVSHDLKAPIFTIKGMLGIIEEEKPANTNEQLIEPLTHIAKAATRLEDLVSSVLEYSKISSQEIRNEDVDLNNTITDVLNDYQHLVKSASATLEIQPGLPVIHADRIRIYQVFSNLVGNAIKYRDSSRPLKIEIGQRATNNQRLVQIYVKDNGLGISQDNLETIFRPFHRIHTDKTEGSGIGLACVKKVVEKLGGQVEVSSEVGQGSTFLVSLRKK